MKVTALIPNQLIEEVRKLTKGKNITDSLIIALKEWIAHKKLMQMNADIAQKPLTFSDHFSAPKVRNLNRKK